jgi:hypothetical protein
MNLNNNVTGMTQLDKGVDITVAGEVITVDKMQAMANMCAPGGSGCPSDCCSDEFKSRLEGVVVDGVDGNVTMHLLGAINAAEVQASLSKCDCYDQKA